MQRPDYKEIIEQDDEGRLLPDWNVIQDCTPVQAYILGWNDYIDKEGYSYNDWYPIEDPKELKDFYTMGYRDAKSP
jgi:hypothetical protein